MTIAIAYCWASGEIGIAAEGEDFELPEGTIDFAQGEIRELTRRIRVRARHSYTPGLFLVPGLPEFDDQEEGEIQIDRITILIRWVDFVFPDWPLNFEHIRVQPEFRAGGSDAS